MAKPGFTTNSMPFLGNWYPTPVLSTSSHVITGELPMSTLILPGFESWHVEPAAMTPSVTLQVGDAVQCGLNEFVVINDSVPNAWALPGGKIGVNRGLLTELGSEAELAAVL